MSPFLVTFLIALHKDLDSQHRNITKYFITNILKAYTYEKFRTKLSRLVNPLFSIECGKHIPEPLPPTSIKRRWCRDQLNPV